MQSGLENANWAQHTPVPCPSMHGRLQCKLLRSCDRGKASDGALDSYSTLAGSRTCPRSGWRRASLCDHRYLIPADFKHKSVARRSHCDRRASMSGRGDAVQAP